MKKIIRLLFVITTCAVTAMKAQIPDTEIFLISMENDSGTFTFGKPENITNRPGYDNQPHFDINTDMLYYVSRPDTTQTEVYIYNPQAKRGFQLTRTPESEFSPTPVRGDKYVACVRVDKDSSQHLYTFTRSGNFPKNLTPKNDSVGYFCWVDSNHYALFVLGKIKTLQLYNTTTGKSDTLAKNPGRCIQNIPGTVAISYTKKTSDSTWVITKYEPFNNKHTEICKSLTGSEDYAWTPDKKILSGKNGKLYMFDTVKNSGWKEIADWTKSVGDFYRIAVNRKGTLMAVVAYKGKKP